MSEKQPSEITRILHEWNNGNDQARELLLPIVYEDLRRQAKYLMKSERSDHTLQPTALVHEAFLRVSGLNEIQWNDRKHFFRFVSQIMRQVLVDHARSKATDKRGNKPIHFSIEDLQIPVEERATAIIRLDEALAELKKVDERKSNIVEMKYFGGMKSAEIAEALEISERTVGREWQEAKFWLYRELNRN